MSTRTVESTARNIVTALVKGEDTRVTVVREALTFAGVDVTPGRHTADGLKSLAELVNSGLLATGRLRDKPFTYQGLAIYVNTGRFITRAGVPIQGDTVAAAFRFISRNPNAKFLAAWEAEHPVESVADFVTSMHDAYAALAASKVALREAAAEEVKPTPANKRDALATSAGDIVPQSADVILATLAEAGMTEWSDDDAARILDAAHALIASLDAMADAREAVTA